ncbi:MAG: DUF4430 domain-containing protein [Clostridia bacterium]|nr:DUF4430 domain-containing protein [Clostridia bacterium]
MAQQKGNCLSRLRACALFFAVILILGLFPTTIFASDTSFKIWVTTSPTLSGLEPHDTEPIFTKLRLYNKESGSSVLITDLNEYNGQYKAFGIEAQSGEYQYEVYADFSDGEYSLGKGEFYITNNSKEIWLAYTNIGDLINNSAYQNLRIELKHQDGRSFSSSPGGSMYFVPAYNGDSYYTFKIIPNDLENYVTYTGHFYVYENSGNSVFKQLNLSDLHKFDLMPRKEYALKVPEDTKAFFVDQAHFYMAWDYEALEKNEAASNSDPDFDYYSADHLGTLLLIQPGRVIRYCDLNDNTNIGTWNEDQSVLTISALKTDPYQVNRDYYEANFMLNTDYSRSLSISSGAYFDLIPLRCWQAVGSITGNDYVDPMYHYIVLGDSVTVEQTEDDYLWQYGRIRAKEAGISLVIFSYDALEWKGGSYADEYGLHCYSALWPENTGVQVVKVDTSETGIHDNIDLNCLDTVYFLRNQTDEFGNTVHHDDFAIYTFSPTSDKGENISVRVHDPYMIENGVLNYNEDNWLADEHWNSFSPNADGSFTVNLKEGRNIIEISTPTGSEYRVINAHAMDVEVANENRPGSKLATMDTAKIKLCGLQTPVYKLGAIFNPSTAADFSLDGTNVRVFAGYDLIHDAVYSLQLERDGTFFIEGRSMYSQMFTLQDGVIGGLSRLTRNSMRSSNYTGQDSPNISSYHSILPSFTFEVEDSAELEELQMREAGKLASLLNRTADEKAQLKNNAKVDSQQSGLNMTAVPKDENAKLFIRWFEVGSTAPTEWNAMISNEKFIVTTATPSYANSRTPGMPWYIQILVVPENGYPYTYSRLYAGGRTKALVPSIGDITITAAEGSGALGSLDGALKADPINSTCNEETISDLGYGFILGEKKYTVSVPYETEQINLNLLGTNGNLLESDTINSNNITISKSDNSSLTYGEAINLDEGENVIIIRQTRTNTSPALNAEYEYVITITRRAAPKVVNFNLPNGAIVLVEQNNKIISANDDGTYTLADGVYTYHVSQPGYLTKTENFTVEGTEAEIIVEVAELEPVPEQNGSVTVRIAGQDAVIRPEKAVEISDDPLDLANQRYVKYNHGGYTVLHALIDACEPAPFTCRNGSFVPQIAIDETGLGPNAGWICRVNGEICPDPANTLVKNGNKIDFYYDSDYTGMLYARFAEEATSVTEGSSATLTLTVGGDPETPIAGADIYLGETKVGTTDSAGKITVPAELLPEKRSYFITAESKNNVGQNILTCAAAIVTVEKDENKESANPGYTTVSFRLIGDTKHGDETQYHAYSTWIGTTSYAFDSEKVSVGDVFQRALTEAGLTFVGLNKNYIESIVGPDGDILEEFSNGKNSGWMFTVNGIHSGQGLNNIYVTDGDEIVWHYVDDYVQETMDNFEGTSGNTATWSTWLDAADGPSINAGVIAAIDGAEISRENNAFTATLPAGSAYPTAAQISVTPEDKAATVSALTGPETDEEGEAWTFSATSESGKTVNYTLKVVVSRIDEVPKEDITNSTCGAAEIVEAPVTYDEADKATATITVKSEQPCVVVVKNPDGTYARLTPEKIDDTTYAFPQTDYDEAMEFTVAIKGDYNGDGEFEIVDLAAANKDLLNEEPIDPVKALIMGADSADELEARNLAILNRAWLNEDTTW